MTEPHVIAALRDKLAAASSQENTAVPCGTPWIHLLDGAY
jgi:hypothetical protein